MIIVNFKGRLGNIMFELAEAVYFANVKNTELRILHNREREYYNEEIYGKEFFGNYKLIEEGDFDSGKFKRLKKNGTRADESSVDGTDNILIDDYFLGRNYAHDEYTRDIFKPSDILKEEILDLYSPDTDSLTMHIRRGDFLSPQCIKGGWYSCPKEYWEAAYALLGKNYKKVFVLSDDLDWCKNTLDIPNMVPVDKETENSKLFFDLFLPSFCGDNIISASTLSWWMQHMNVNPNKKVIMPYPWNTIEGNARNKIYYTDNCMKLGIYDYKLK